jgi:hypothetical protein
VIVYLDTGVFLDYLAPRGHAGTFLRITDRRGRPVDQLSEDAAKCLIEIDSNHVGITSCLTLYEVEHAMYEKLRDLSSGLSDRHRYLITSARSLTVQVLSVVKYHKIRVLDLSQAIFEKTVAEIDLQSRAIEAADSIHVATGIVHDVDLIISTDDHMLNLNGIFRNSSGGQIQCLDTDDALLVLQ